MIEYRLTTWKMAMVLVAVLRGRRPQHGFSPVGVGGGVEEVIALF